MNHSRVFFPLSISLSKLTLLATRAFIEYLDLTEKIAIKCPSNFILLGFFIVLFHLPLSQLLQVRKAMKNYVAVF